MRQLRPSVWISPDSEPPLFHCRVENCSATFDGVASLREHLLVSHVVQDAGGEELRCPVSACQRPVADSDDLKRHLLYHAHLAGLQGQGLALVRREFPGLRDCGVESSTSAALHYDGSAFRCAWDECGHSFDDVEEFAAHVSGHVDTADKEAGSDAFACAWARCEYGTPSRRTLRVHCRRHSGLRSSACPFCAATFHDPGNKLRLHLARRPEAPAEARLVCFHCQKTFASQRLLAEHCRRHLRHYACAHCGWSAETPSDLRRHVTRRHGDAVNAAPSPSHPCPWCPRSFFALSDLRRHAATHLPPDERTQLACPQCAKTFATSGSLLRHRRRAHSETEAFRCHLCPAAFKLGEPLARHLSRAHCLAKTPAHPRFVFKLSHDGFYRLQTHRYESEHLLTLS